MWRPEQVSDERVLPVQHRVRPPAERPDEQLRVAAAADEIAPEVVEDGNAEVRERDGEIDAAGGECRPCPAALLLSHPW